MTPTRRDTVSTVSLSPCFPAVLARMVLQGSRPGPTSHLQSANQRDLFRSRARGVGSGFSYTQNLSSWARRTHTCVQRRVQPPWGHDHCQGVLPAPSHLLKIQHCSRRPTEVCAHRWCQGVLPGVLITLTCWITTPGLC